MTGADGGRLRGRVALVTGGAQGIGAGTVRRLVEEGARVVVADVLDAAAAELCAELGPATLAAHVDVTEEAEVAAAVDLAVDRFGRLDIAFANAGIIGATGSIAQSRMDDVARTLAVDLCGVFLTTKHAARVMVPQGSGLIVSTASPAAVLGGLGAHAYSAAKAGVIGLMRSVAAELRPRGIRVNCVIPGATVSPMTAALLTGDPSDVESAEARLGASAWFGRPVLPRDIGAAVAFLAGEDGELITGQTLVVDAGLCAIGGNSPMATGRKAEPRMYGGSRA